MIRQCPIVTARFLLAFAPLTWRIFGTLSYPEVAGDPGNPIWPSLAFTKFGSNRKMKEDRPPAMPAWVKWLAVLLVTLLLAAGLLATFGGGNHGPGRHFTTEQG
jgi:hypothetical protein